MGAMNDTQSMRTGIGRYRLLAFGIVGMMMLVASILPWFTYPLGGNYGAWQIPVDIGWQIRSGIISYGFLCACCALYTFLMMFNFWRAGRSWMTPAGRKVLTRSTSTLGGILCLLPPTVFLFQYLFVDMTNLARIASEEIQFSLLKQHLGYGLAASFFPINPLQVDPSSLSSRCALVFNHIGIGFFLPIVCALILFTGPKLASATELGRRKHLRWQTITVGTLLITAIFGRSLIAQASYYQAQHLLTIGDYTGALTWLNRTIRLNPSFDQLTEYRVERGKAWYYTHSSSANDDSKLYLAYTYFLQKDYLSSYQTLRSLNKQQEIWSTSLLDLTLEQLVEQSKPLRGGPILRLKSDNPALLWLQEAVRVDPSSVYNQYLLGRIDYDIHDYAACEDHMARAIALNNNNDILSSAYTYIALSHIGSQDYVNARTLLLQAVVLDPEYRNNTAREELSGLR